MCKWMALLIIFSTVPLAAGVQGDLRQGGKLYNQKKYGQALEKYNEILGRHPSDQEAALGAGASSYYLKDYSAAQAAFSQAAEQESPRQADALFDLGNAYYRANELDKASQAYRQAILKNLNDKDAIHNLQLLLEDQQNQQQKNDQNNQNQQNNSANQQPKQGDESKAGNNQSVPAENKQSPEQQDQQPDQPQDSPSQAEKDAADRVMQMAREKEAKPQQQNNKGFSDNLIEKDW